MRHYTSFTRQAVSVIAACALMLASGCESTVQQTLKVQVGQRFPELPLRDRENQSVMFNVEPGKVTLINIWATWCGPCRHEMPSLQRLSEQLQQRYRNARVVGISVDNDALVMREYLIDKKLTFTNYRDQDMRAANELLGVRAFPSTFIVDKQGNIREIVEAWRYWDKPEVLATFKRLLAEG